MNVQEQFAVVYDTFQRVIVEVLPRVLTGLAITIALVVAALVIERLLRAFLVRVQFDHVIKRAGFDKALHRLGVRQSPALVLPKLVYYLMLLFFARIGADLLGLRAVSDAIASMFGYLPNVLAALLLLAVGSLIAQFAGQAVARAADESGIDFSRSLGNIVSGLILFVVTIMAIAQLKIDTDMVRIFTVCLLSGFALAFGLSFGLGTRDVSRNILAGFYARQIFQPGDPVEIRGFRGVLKGITATQTVIEQEHGLVMFANSVFFDETVRG